MAKYIEGKFVMLLKSGLLGILTDDYRVYELSPFQSMEYLAQDGTWKSTSIFASNCEEWDVVSMIENSMPVDLGMPVRYEVWQGDEGVNNIPDGTDDELPECFRI